MSLLEVVIMLEVSQLPKQVYAPTHMQRQSNAAESAVIIEVTVRMAHELTFVDCFSGPCPASALGRPRKEMS